MQKILAIIGPTATGKTDLAIKLAKKFNGELIACDSRQVYKTLDIGSGKEANKSSKVKKHEGYWIIDGVKVWMYDIVQVSTQYSVTDYVKDAEYFINSILERGKLAIIVGGTGLYLKGLLEGIPHSSIPINAQLRGELEEESLEEVQRRLQLLSPTVWESLNPSEKQNKRRLIRYIEKHMYGYKRLSKKLEVKSKKFNALKIGLTTPLPLLRQRINDRLDRRLNQGLVKEVEQLKKKGINSERLQSLGLEYRLTDDYVEKRLSYEDYVKTLKLKIGQYAKRQMTWFKRDEEINWFDIADQSLDQEVEKLVRNWYNKE